MTAVLAVFVLTLISVTYLAYTAVPDRQQIAAVFAAAAELDAGGERPTIFNVRLVRVAIASILPYVKGMGSARYRDVKRVHLRRAGFDPGVSVDEILAFKVLAAGLIFVGVLIYPIPFFFKLVAAAFGFFFPDIWLVDRAKFRQHQIVRELPFMLDLLVLLVEAGLDFTAAVAKSVEKMKPGPLRNELDRMLKEVRLGASRSEALRSLARRLKAKEITTFSTALIQASELGASIAGTLRQQSEIVRATRFQKAEEQGSKASQKMLLPLVMFILPAVVLMIAGPLIINFLRSGLSGGF